MDFFILAQIISIGYIITTIIALLYKEKFKVMFWFFLANIMLLTTYLLLERYLATILVLGACFRTLIYYLYSKKNIKPNIGIFIAFEAYFIISSVLLYNDIYDLLMIINLTMLTYTTWQNNMFTLRLGYLLSSIILITYDIMVGAYVAIISEVILLIIAIISIYKHDFKNKINDIVYDFYSTIAPTYDIKIKKNELFQTFRTSLISDEFNNFTYFSNIEKFNYCKNNNSEQIDKSLPIYVFNNDPNNTIPISILCKNNFLNYNDVWMKLKTQNNFLPKKCQIENLQIKKCDENYKADIINVFNKGFINNNGDNIYKLSDEYIKNYEEKIKLDFFVTHNITPYLAYNDNKPIGLLFMYKNNEYAYICQLTTIPEERKKGVATILLRTAIKEEQKNGLQDFYLVTENNTFLELFYMKNNFEEIGQGFCLNLKQEKSINKNKQKQLIEEIKELETKLKEKRINLSKFSNKKN